MRTFSRYLIVTLALLSPAVARARDPDKSGGFFKSDDTVVFLGGTSALESSFHGYLETLIRASRPECPLTFRTMAWEADTVYYRQRPLNFPKLTAQLSDAGADVLVLRFGRMEAFDGAERVSEFKDAYRKLLDRISADRRLVLVSPTRYEPPPTIDLPDNSERNKALAVYANAVREIAGDRGATFVDLFAASSSRDADANPLTVDGVQLSRRGHREAAEFIAGELESAGRFEKKMESLRALVREKNRLWFAYWRPTNWAFLHGDRIHVPSSRDHRDMEIRWFPSEVEQYRPLVQKLENRIADEAATIHD